MQSDSRRRRIRLIKSVEQRSQTLRHPKTPRSQQSGESREANAALLRRLFAECGGDAAVEIIVERDGHPKRLFTMDRPFRIIGTAPACDIQLEGDEISPWRSIIHWIDGQLFYCSISQHSPISAGQNREVASQWMNDSPLIIGAYRISIVPKGTGAQSRPSPLDRSLRLASEYPQLGFQFVGVEQSDALWPINRTLTLIGRGSQCKLRLNHKSVAPVQAILVRTSTGCWLMDIAKDGKTAINDEAFSISPIDVGDILGFGDFQVEVVTSEFLPVPPAAQTVAPREHLATQPIVAPQTETAVENQDPPSLNGAARSPEVAHETTDADQSHSKLEPPAVTEEENGRASVPQIVETLGLNAPSSIPPVGVRIQPSIATNSPLAVAPIAVVSPPCKSEGEELLQVIDSTFEPSSHVVESAVVESAVVESAVVESAVVESAVVESAIDAPIVEASEKCMLQKVNSICDDATLPEVELHQVPSTAPIPQVPMAADVRLQSFVELQRSMLLELKERLLTLERVYQEEAKYMVSARMKRTLAAPVVETMKCYESIMESFEQFLNPAPTTQGAEVATAEDAQESSPEVQTDGQSC